jgi:hypothetical protein
LRLPSGNFSWKFVSPKKIVSIWAGIKQNVKKRMTMSAYFLTNYLAIKVAAPLLQ